MCNIQSYATRTEQRHFTRQLPVFAQDVRQQGNRHCSSSLGVSESRRVLVHCFAVNVRSLLFILNECVENVGLRVHRTRVLSNTCDVYCTSKFHRWSQPWREVTCDSCQIKYWKSVPQKNMFLHGHGYIETTNHSAIDKQDRQCTHKRNIKTHSHNISCHGKARSIVLQILIFCWPCISIYLS